ncbi:hypothetical protein [Roseibium sediminicola]|uniref:Uncharacterized protein n=1 Tax=Roseibium sediminicola TaxID=2933272 RepID=A0ABT0GW94_9HYPH|nr:hypothetical protein [Roseibium sp. CAU 1639]MCK7613715.1 hypothetical protein [Roseibium sp. CAU 1639]
MTRKQITLALVAACLCLEGTAATAREDMDRLVLPAQGTSIDLESGLVRKNGVAGLCVEKVSRAGPNTLVVAKSPGDDIPLITLNGAPSDMDLDGTGARLGTLQATRDGALVWLRHFKTGNKQTELLEDGAVRYSWPAGNVVRLLRATGSDFVLLVDVPGQQSRLQKWPRETRSTQEAAPVTLVNFDGCVPARLRFDKHHVWARMSCDRGRGDGIYRIELDGGAIEKPVNRSETAEFVSLPKGAESDGQIAVATVSGSEAGLHFYFAVKGLLLAQAGEVRACSSDAEGLQSWNQSYRLRALASLFEKTDVSAFADLAVKSMSLTLAAQDGANDREGLTTPACGWSSRIYSGEGKDRLSLMINQAVIANALHKGCKDLGAACPARLRDQIGQTAGCLAEAFEPDFDVEAGLYRIREDIDFRFSGEVAPWNWQLSFAGLLRALPDKNLTLRANTIFDRFLKEVKRDADGSLWRYWPESYYREKGLDPSGIRDQRFEDTGHAGISLMALAGQAGTIDASLAAALKDRARFLLGFGPETPRDLDGSGPRGTRWFPAGGWADIAPEALGEAYAGPVPGAQSADALYAYASLFDPASDFDLRLDLLLCSDACVPYRSLSYDSWHAFLDNNPFFVLSRNGPSNPREN